MVVVFNMWRYARNVPEGRSLLAELENDGIQLMSASREDMDISKATGEFTVTMMLVVGQLLVRRSSEAWKSTVLQSLTVRHRHGAADRIPQR